MQKTQHAIGVLAFQGGVQEHLEILQKIGQKGVEVRSAKDLQTCDALIIPGGESTVMGFFLRETGLLREIRKRVLDKKNPMPIFGTCAGAILLAKKIESEKVPPHLNLMDIVVERNAYGTQIDSFSTQIDVPKLKIKNLQAAFIRAPIIHSVEENKGVEILATFQKKIVLVQQNKILAATFHPELVGETRLHEYFCALGK